ncbi:MAG: MtrB/PioB family decaheme-associated outer membrane protein [Rhizomicrobium sp.]
MLPLIAVAQAQDNNGFDISDTAPAASQAPAPQSLATSIAEVTFGVGGVSQASAAFGRYNGMPDAGSGVVGGWNLQNRDASDSGGTHYFSFTGDNIDFGFGRIAPEASVNLKTGQQGLWSLSASYDAMTYTASDHFTSILDKKGNLSPSYQAALIANGLYFNDTTTAPPSSSKFGSFNATTHLATSNPVAVYGPGNQLVENVGTRRDKGTVGGSYQMDSWQFTAAVSHEHKEGTLEQAMTTGGNNAGMVTFPMPIDYDTDNYTVAAAYNTDELQAAISYEFSDFIDHNSAGYLFQGWNFAAYKNTAVKPNTYTSYAKSGDYALPPSNQAHTITGQIGYNVSPTTRLNGTLVYGLQLQNDPFVAATQLGYIFSAAGSSLSAQLASNPKSLDGLVQTFFGNVTLTSRPLPKLDIKASYTIDARDPQTRSMWIYGDPTDTTALKYREAVAESWTKQDFVLTAGYHILPETRVTVGYAFRDAHRGNAITHDTQDSEESVKLQSTLATNVTGSLGYVHSDRTASAPDWSLWLVQIPSDCGSTLATLGCQQVPFYEAARTQDAVTGMLTGMIDQETSLSLFGKFSNDQYHLPVATYNGTVNPSVGINRDYSIQAGPDLNYQVDKDSEVHAFYTFLRTCRAIRGLNDQNHTTAGGNYYSETSTYDIHTAGIGGTWRANDKLKFGADYVLSFGNQRFVQSGSWDTSEAGQTFGGDPLLSTPSSNHQVKIHATYDYSPDTSFYLGYQFASLDMSDWALVGASVGQVLTGDVPAKYNVSTVMAAVTLKL